MIESDIGARANYDTLASVEVPASLLATTTANPKAPAGSSSTAPSLSVTSIQKEAKKKYLLNPTTDPLLSELMDLNFSAVGKTLNKTARRLDEDYKVMSTDQLVVSI